MTSHQVEAEPPTGGDVLPDCMMPDGADPCFGYRQHADTIARLRERVAELEGEDFGKYVKRVEAELASLKAAEDHLADSQWIAGAKFGWNCGVDENHEHFNECINARIRDRVLDRSLSPPGKGG